MKLKLGQKQPTKANKHGCGGRRRNTAEETEMKQAGGGSGRCWVSGSLLSAEAKLTAQASRLQRTGESPQILLATGSLTPP